MRRGFSLVEVALALGVASFALLLLLALLPLGVKSNQISAEETKAAMILNTLEADLRNTHPGLNSGKSAIFKLHLPYQIDSSGNYAFNTAASGSTSLTRGSDTVSLDEGEKPVLDGSPSRQRFQVSVIYQPRSAATPLAATQARLVVSWPSQAGSSIPTASITDPTKVEGFLETLVSFPAP